MAQGNVSYQKTDFGAETPDLFQYYVRKLAQIAGIPIRDGIDKDELKEALGITDAESVIEFLQKALVLETNERQSEDTALGGRVDELSRAIANEAQARIEAVGSEVSNRTAEDTALRQLITTLQAIAHTHDNQALLDTITEERIGKWEQQSQVTQEQLDAVFEHLYEIAIGHDLELEKVYYAIGLTVYDGGLIGAPISGTLDCGEIDDEITGIIDCGGPEPYIAEIAADSSTIDGGTLDTPSDGSKIIDGGEIK